MNEAGKIKQATYHLYTFTISKLISTFGSSVYAFGISLYVLALTGSAASFAVNLICSILPRTVFAPFAGYVADNYPKKPSCYCPNRRAYCRWAGYCSTVCRTACRLSRFIRRLR